MRDEQNAVIQPHARLLRRLRIATALIGALALALLAAPAAFADGGREIRIRDKCDPATFNAALGPGACVGDGDVTFAELLATINPADGGHDAWNFSREELTIRVGETVSVLNSGGEAHTFTEVRNFGAGLVDALNPALPPGTPPAIPVDPNFFPNLPGSFVAELVFPTQAKTIAGLSQGKHLFQCMIHPWMRSTITVRSR
jgi:plastocyanin